MNENEIRTKLDQLADLRAASDAIALQKQALIETVLTPEIKAKLADIDAEFAEKSAAVVEKAAALEAEVRQAVLEYCASVKGTFLQCVWAKGKTTWDTKTLDGYALAHPEINVLRKVGEPTVRLQGVK